MNIPMLSKGGLKFANEYDEENEIDEEANSDVCIELGLTLEENDVIFQQRHATTSQWRDTEGPKENKSVCNY